jgi:ATP-dependent protease HslVU (ClpYQ) peptidase subunit
MTCTIAYKDGKVVLIGSDSAAVEGNTICIRKHRSKCWKQGEFVVGFCGDFGFGLWLRHVFRWPEVSCPIEEWLVADIQTRLHREVVERFGKSEDWNVIIGIRGRIFVLSSCGDVEETNKPYAAIGSGAEFAKGVLWSMESSTCPSWEKIDAALIASAEFVSDVRGPMHIVTTLD